MMMKSAWVAILDEAVAGEASPFSAEDFLNKLFPNVWSFLINLIALVVLFVAVYFLAYKPLRKLVKQRQDYVEHNLRDSESAKAISEQKAKEADKLIDEANIEAGKIIDKAKIDAQAKAQEIEEMAIENASKKQQEADIAIKQAEEKSRKAIHDEIVNLAMDASKQLLMREVNGNDNKELLNEFIDDVGKGEDGK